MKKRKKRRIVETSTMFLEAASHAEEQEKLLIEENKRIKEMNRKKLEELPKTLPKDSDLFNQTRRSFRKGKMIYQPLVKATPIQRKAVDKYSARESKELNSDPIQHTDTLVPATSIKKTPAELPNFAKKSIVDEERQKKSAKINEQKKLDTDALKDFVASFNPTDENLPGQSQSTMAKMVDSFKATNNSTSLKAPSSQISPVDFRNIPIHVDNDVQTLPVQSIDENNIPPKDLNNMHVSAKYVAQHGEAFERLLMTAEINNPAFGFLEPDHPHNQAFKLMVYLHANHAENHDLPVRLYKSDKVSYKLIRNAELNNILRKLSAVRECEKAGKQYQCNMQGNQVNNQSVLHAWQVRKLQELLSELSIDREQIKQLMGFCLDFGEHSEEILQTLLKDLLAATKYTTSNNDNPGWNQLPLSNEFIGKSIAMLYLLNDLLHNSSAAIKNASQYHSHIQKLLPDVFLALNRVVRSAERMSGRFTVDAIKKRILSVVDAWKSKFMFPKSFLIGLECVFLFDGEICNQVVSSTHIHKTYGISTNLTNDTVDAIMLMIQEKIVSQETAARPAAPAPTVEVEELVPEVIIDLPPEKTVEEVSFASNSESESESDLDGQPLSDSDLDGEPF